MFAVFVIFLEKGSTPQQFYNLSTDPCEIKPLHRNQSFISSFFVNLIAAMLN